MPPSKALQAILWTLFGVGVAASNNTNKPHDAPVHDDDDDADPIRREYNQAVKVYFNAESGNLFVMIPKPPAGHQLDKKELKDFLRPLVREIARPADKRKDGIEKDGKPRWRQMKPKKLTKKKPKPE